MPDVVRQHEHTAEKMNAQADVRNVIIIMLGWLGFVCFGAALLAVIFYKTGGYGRYPNTQNFPSPHLHAHPYDEWYREVAGQIQDLHHYGWIDEKKGIAHIPITRAMAAIVKRSDPYAPLSGSGTAGQPNRSSHQGSSGSTQSSGGTGAASPGAQTSGNKNGHAEDTGAGGASGKADKSSQSDHSGKAGKDSGSGQQSGGGDG